MLATMVNDHGSSWEDHLPKVCFAYNTSTHTSTTSIPTPTKLQACNLTVIAWLQFKQECYKLNCVMLE